MRNCLILVMLFTCLKSFGQLPENDGTWQMNWYDEFNYSGKPDPNKWKLSFPWGPVANDNLLVMVRARFNKLAESIDTSGGNYKLVSNKKNTALDFVLYQNSPNPFNLETSISYSLKGTYSTANLYIFDLQGTLKKSYSLNSSSSLTVKRNELTPGMYFYSFVVDGKENDTKIMILTK
jgi:hypothetical protein